MGWIFVGVGDFMTVAAADTPAAIAADSRNGCLTNRSTGAVFEYNH
jgi:hypothetical protein